MDLSLIRTVVSAFGSRAIQAGYLANPEMRRSCSGKSRGDFRRNREDYSHYKCTIAIVYDSQLSFWGSEQWDENRWIGYSEGDASHDYRGGGTSDCFEEQGQGESGGVLIIFK